MTEVAYLFANGVRLARLAYEPPGDVPSINGESLHVFFELGDHLGSTSVVLDKATGELVERSTYQAYGGTESDYRPERWKSFREDYRLTGKEEDVEAGLIYFGKRFLNPLLNRWVSADPLAIHGLGADPNLYAYVSGRALQSVDPLGLDEKGQDVTRNFKNEADFQKRYSSRATAKPPEKAVPKAAPKASKPLPKRPDIDPNAKEGKGECQGPACGWNKGHGGNIKESDLTDAVAIGAALVQDQVATSEDGVKDGSPDGGCLTCAASKLQQKAVIAMRVVRGIVEAFGAKIATMASKLVGHVLDKALDAATTLNKVVHGVQIPHVSAGSLPPPTAHVPHLPTSPRFGTGNFAAGELDNHFLKHAGEWGEGNITKTGYLKRSRALLDSPVGGDIVGKVRPSNGDILRYNKRTNEFAVGRADGSIRTLFRPTDGLDYWKKVTSGL